MSSSSQQQQHPGGEAEAAPDDYSTEYVGAPGVRFVPSDQELIIDYLWPKLLGQKPPTDLVHEADVYEEHPRDLTSRLGRSVEGFWYVFSTRNRKYAKGKRPSRSTGTAGRWKAVGKNLEVFLGGEDGKDTDADGNKRPVIGHKCGLAYELFVRDEDRSRPRTDKTDWKMCEFVANDTNRPISSDPGHMLLNEWVLCKISRKAAAAAEGQMILAEEEGHEQPMDEPLEDEQPPEGAAFDPSSQLAHAMPNMPYLLPHDGGDDGSDGTEVVQIEGSGAALELPPDGDCAATDVAFVDWQYCHQEPSWDDEYGVAFDDHHNWDHGLGVAVDQFGATADPDPMVNRFEVPADPDLAVSPIDLPSDPQSWEIASDLLFADDGHELTGASDDAGGRHHSSKREPSWCRRPEADIILCRRRANESQREHLVLR